MARKMLPEGTGGAGTMTGRRRDDGFTMTEMSVTLAVIAILAAIAIPNIMGLMPRIKLGSAAQTLANEIAMLRMTAISRSNVAEVRFDPAGESYSLSRQVPGGAFTDSPLPSRIEMEGVTWFDGSNAGVNAVRLQANGTVDAYNGGTRVAWRPDLSEDRTMVCVVLQTAGGEQRRRVVVSMVGRVRTQKWTGAAWVED